MTQQRWTTRTVIKYVLLQLPGLALLIATLILARRWVDVPAWLFWGIIAIWMAKDAVLFPLTWRAYDSSRTTHVHSMIGERGTAKDTLSPEGYVWVRGALWKAEVAEGCPPIQDGEEIRVGGTRGLTLLVEPGGEEKS